MDEEELLERSPFLVKLKARRLAPSRLAELMASARSSKPPKEPELWECCGSSCKPCVKELYREQLRVWSEIHPDGPESDEEVQGDQGAQAKHEEEALLTKRLENERRESPKVEIGVEEQLAELSVKDTRKEQRRKLAKEDAW